MSDTLGKRIFLAHLELSYRLGRRVTLEEFGEMIAKRMRRDQAFTGPAVSRWEGDLQTPALEVVEAIAAITSTDPGWLSHGDRSAAPRPAHLEGEGGNGRGRVRASRVALVSERGAGVGKPDNGRRGGR